MIARLVYAAAAALLCSPALAAVQVEFAGQGAPVLQGKVWVAPARIEFSPRFLADMERLRSSAGRMRPGDREQLALEVGAEFRNALLEALKEHGFQVLSAPAPDALTLAPAVTELYVNAPADRLGTRVYARSAGEASMSVEGRAPSGEPLFHARGGGPAGATAAFHERHAGEIRHTFRSTFSDWAREMAAALSARR